jgi:hypothetical protein
LIVGRMRPPCDQGRSPGREEAASQRTRRFLPVVEVEPPDGPSPSSRWEDGVLPRSGCALSTIRSEPPDDQDAAFCDPRRLGYEPQSNARLACGAGAVHAYDLVPNLTERRELPQGVIYNAAAPTTAAEAAEAAVSLGTQVFSTNGGLTGAVAENVTQTGGTLTFDNFTISALKKTDLVAPAKQLLQFAAERGATTLRFTGIFSNPAIAARFGLGIGDAFDISVAATRGGIVSLLGGL